MANMAYEASVALGFGATSSPRFARQVFRQRLAAALSSDPWQEDQKRTGEAFAAAIRATYGELWESA